MEHGVPLFLTQLSETLRLEATSAPFPPDAIGAAAARHGGDCCDQASRCPKSSTTTATSARRSRRRGRAARRISVEEFHILNRCLDTAIAEAVTEHARVTAESRSAGEIARLGYAAHELRDSLNTAILAFHTLKRGAVAINGSTGAVLGRSLMSLRELIDRTLSEVRLEAGKQRRARVAVVTFIDEIAATGMLHSEYRQIRFTVDPIDPALCDRRRSAAARVGGDEPVAQRLQEHASRRARVLRARAEEGRLLIDIEDQCGGIPQTKGDLFQVFGDRRGSDRSGLGLGLSIARKAVRAHGGDIRIRNMPGKGCVFTIDMPLGTEASLPEAIQPFATP